VAPAISPCRDIYVIVAVGPEAQVDSAGFAAAGNRGNERLAALEDH
jgi:hypothetical protein